MEEFGKGQGRIPVTCKKDRFQAGFFGGFLKRAIPNESGNPNRKNGKASSNKKGTPSSLGALVTKLGIMRQCQAGIWELKPKEIDGRGQL